MSYLVWRALFQDKFCALGALHGVPSDEEIFSGISRADAFPEDAYYEMLADHPKGIAVPDYVYSMIHYVVSRRLRDALEPELGASRVEFLPVKIKNHKGRFVQGDYFVMNSLDVIDAIDVGASAGEFNPIAPTQLMSVEQIVLKVLPDRPVMFRPANWTRLIIVRRDVAEKLLAAGMTGLIFTELEDYMG